jgi:hypothetical protein
MTTPNFMSADARRRVTSVHLHDFLLNIDLHFRGRCRGKRKSRQGAMLKRMEVPAAFRKWFLKESE